MEILDYEKVEVPSKDDLIKIILNEMLHDQ